MKKICVFTGAGIGVPLKLPATDGFNRTIKNINHDLLNQIKSFFDGTNDINDIEKVLYSLEDFIRKEDFANAIIKNMRNQGHIHFVNVDDFLKDYRERAEKTVQQIKSDIFNILEEYEPNDAFNLYSSLIQEIRSFLPNSAFSFFTTNYDLTFETGFYENEKKLSDIGIKDIYFGFGKSRLGKSVYSPEEDFEWNPEIIEYKKLHGSLDWNKDNKGNCIKTGVTTQPKDPAKMPLLYPGFKGVPSIQPFIDIHDRFSERIGQADIMFVLGFAFRDQYINNIFDFSLKRNKDLRVFCFNPCEHGKYPSDSKLEYFSKTYPKSFIHIKSGVALNSTPLNLKKHIVSLDDKVKQLFTL